MESMRAGAYGYLLKGTPDDLLASEVGAAVSARRMRERNRELEAANLAYRNGLEAMVAEKTAEVHRLQRISAEAEKLATLGTLIAGVAHEINNPLAVITANLSWMRDNLTRSVSELAALNARAACPAPEDEVPQIIDETLSCSGRIKRIVQSLKRLSRKAPVEGRCAITAALESVRLITRHDCAERCELKFNVPEDAGAVRISLDDLVSVLANLVGNAAHAVTPGKGRVEVTVGRENGFARIDVRDNGSGIPEPIKGRVFDPFFTTKPLGDGMGLGLALVRQIVQGAGGSIDLQSEVGAGTTFVVRLPLAPASAAAA